MQLGIFIKIGICLFHNYYSIFWREICIWSIKQWFRFVSWVFQLLFRKIKLTWIINEGRYHWHTRIFVRALARFIDCHVTRFRPIASAHFGWGITISDIGWSNDENAVKWWWVRMPGCGLFCYEGESDKAASWEKDSWWHQQHYGAETRQ